MITLRVCGLGALIFVFANAPLIPPPSSTLGQAGEKAAEPRSNPLVKSEMDATGREKFRWYQWVDAFEKFKLHPWLGIGFERQVVHRVYRYSGEFAPNDENWLNHSKAVAPVKVAPIAGPHNSYLNALTRMGLMGAFVLVLHALALCYLICHHRFLMASIVYAHIVYSFFNVGLEGPVRSALLLLLLSVPLLESPMKNDPLFPWRPAWRPRGH